MRKKNKYSKEKTYKMKYRDRLLEPFVDTRPKKTLADVRLRGTVDGGKVVLLVNFLGEKGNVISRGEYDSFNRRENALEAKRDIISINPAYNPEIQVRR